jgi:pilus assembly protein CpaC
MRKISIVWVFVINVMMSAVAAAQQQMTLLVEQSTLVDVTENTQIMVGDESKIAARLVTPTQLMLKALQPGYTDVWLINNSPERLLVTVEQPIDRKLLLELDGLKAADTALATVISDNFVVAKGEVMESTRQRLQRLAEDYPQLLDQSQSKPSDSPMLRLRVKILEIKQQRLKELGIEWQNATSGPAASTAIQGTFSWSAQMASTLNLLQTQGHAKLLASPTLSAQSGESAAFLAGGEIPIPQVLAQGMQDVTFRAYGIKLDIAPEVTATGKIKTQLSAEVSNLDPAVSVNGVPGILTRRTDSVFLADDNDTLVLSGLMSHERSRSESQTPAMGDLPVIGQLFRSRELREQQTELVIMVTAERLDMAQQRLNAKNQRLEQQTNWLSEAGCVGLQEVTDE